MPTNTYIYQSSSFFYKKDKHLEVLIRYTHVYFYTFGCLSTVLTSLQFLLPYFHFPTSHFPTFTFLPSLSYFHFSVHLPAFTSLVSLSCYHFSTFTFPHALSKFHFPPFNFLLSLSYFQNSYFHFPTFTSLLSRSYFSFPNFTLLHSLSYCHFLTFTFLLSFSYFHFLGFTFLTFTLKPYSVFSKTILLYICACMPVCSMYCASFTHIAFSPSFCLSLSFLSTPISAVHCGK